MSTKLLALVWENAHYTGTRKLVLLAFADAANPEGLCWPSMRTIARMSECSLRRAREHASKLVADDWLERREEPGHSNLYLVHMPEKLQRAAGLILPDVVTPYPGETSPDYPGETSPDYPGETSPGLPDVAENAANPGEISPGGRRNLAGGAAKSRRGGRRNLAGRTVIEPSVTVNEPEEAPTPQNFDSLATFDVGALTPGREPAARLWARVVSDIARRLPESQVASWITPARLACYGWTADGEFYAEVTTPGRAQADMLERRYSYFLADALTRALGGGITAGDVALVIRAEPQPHRARPVTTRPTTTEETQA